MSMNFVPDVLTNPVGKGGATVPVELVVVLVVVTGGVVETVELVEEAGRHWKKKGFKTVHTNGEAQTIRPGDGSVSDADKLRVDRLTGVACVLLAWCTSQICCSVCL